jgi:PGAP1-like protein
VAVLICPAQFCVPADYQDLVQALSEQYGDTVAVAAVAPLPRTEWIKVARQLPTKEFVQAQLSVFDTLKWYFDAMDLGIAHLLLQAAAAQSDSGAASAAHEKDPPLRLCIVGHSIGGWVARAYLGGMSRSSTAAHKWALESCTSLITLGTPHASTPPNGGIAWVDQTRGLLRQIDETEACRSSALAERGIDVTCVCSDSLRAGMSSVEEAVALASYLPLLGRYDPNVRGDGIVPLDLAFLDEPARKVVVQGCSVTSNAVRHSHVLPTPWNLWDGYAPSMALPDEFCSYTSPGVLSQWAKYIR